jgi:predicted permease
MRGLRGVRRLFRLPETESSVASDVANEIAFHIDMRVQDFMRQGMSETEARRCALREFGDAADAQRELSGMAVKRARTNRRAALHEAIGQDIRSALRSLRHDPVFTIGVIATLALAIGVNAAMFDVADAVLFRGPPHVADARNVVHVYFGDNFPGYGETRLTGFSYPLYTELAGVQAFDAVAGYTTDTAPAGEGSTADRVAVLVTTSTYFDVVGLKPALGRFFSADEDVPAAPANVVVISDAYWRRQYGSARAAIGQTIRIARRPYTIIGVTPRGFHGVDLDAFDVMMPASAYGAASHESDWYSSSRESWVSVLAHRRPGVSDAVAIRQTTAVWQAGHPGYGQKPEQHAILTPLQPRALLQALRDGESDAIQLTSILFLAVTLVVLLIACANLANLLVARTIRRTRELGVRVALGVSRSRLLLLLGAEATLLAIASGIAGLLLARAVGNVARNLLLPGVDFENSVLSLHTASYGLALLLFSAAVLTVAPALQMRRLDVQDALKTGSREGGGRRARMRYALVATQAALTVVLLVCAGLFARSLQRIQAVHLGYTPDRVLVMRWDRRGTDHTASEWANLYAAALTRVRNVPGVERASIATEIPFATATSVQVKVPGRDTLPTMPDGAPYTAAVDPSYFATLGARVLRGRAFNETDRAGSPPVALVDAAFADFVWHSESPIGRTICARDVCSEVIGVVDVTNRNSVFAEPAPQFFTPLAQEPVGSRTLFVRVRNDDAATRTLVRDAVQSVAPGLPFASIRSLSDIIDPTVRPFRLKATLFAALASLALCVAIVGLYSVMSYAVTSRRHEMGVRLALGARGAEVMRLILAEAARVLGSGIVVGVIVALWAMRWTKAMLFKVDVHDPIVYVAVSVLIAAVGMAAAWIPAVRSQRISAAEVLRDG